MDIKDTWQAGKETDVLLAQLRGDPAGVVEALQDMSVRELAGFGQHLWTIQGLIGDVATAKSRGLPSDYPNIRR